MEFTIKKRITLFLETFTMCFILGFITDYFLKNRNMNYYTIISVALGLSLSIAFMDKFKPKKKKK